MSENIRKEKIKTAEILAENLERHLKQMDADEYTYSFSDLEGVEPFLDSCDDLIDNITGFGRH